MRYALNATPLAALLLLLFVLPAPQAQAEELGNYADCYVCDGAIYYPAHEAREFLGATVRTALTTAPALTSVKKVLLTEELTPLPEGATTDHVEVTATRDMLVIAHRGDGSFIQIYLDPETFGNENAWAPRLYLQAAHDDGIDLSQPLTAGWAKLKQSSLWSWLTKGGPFEKQLPKKVAAAIKALHKN